MRSDSRGRAISTGTPVSRGVPCVSAAPPSEMIAQVWARGEQPREPAARCAQAPQHSPRYFEILMPFHRRFAYAIAPGASSQYFCVGLFAD